VEADAMKFELTEERVKKLAIMRTLEKAKRLFRKGFMLLR
jgi:hypothetical protein